MPSRVRWRSWLHFVSRSGSKRASARCQPPHPKLSTPLFVPRDGSSYLLLERLRTLGCHGTELARATAGTIRLQLLKVAAQVTVSVRRVYIRLSSAYPRPGLFRLCHARLMRLAPADG